MRKTVFALVLTIASFVAFDNKSEACNPALAGNQTLLLPASSCGLAVGINTGFNAFGLNGIGIGVGIGRNGIIGGRGLVGRGGRGIARGGRVGRR